MQVRLKRRYDMFQKKPVSLVLAFACAVTVLSGASSLQARAAAQFDPAFYGAAYPDVVAVFGTDPQALLNHYLAYGMAEGRFPSAAAQPGEAVDGIAATVPASAPADPASAAMPAGPASTAGSTASAVQAQPVFQPVPMDQLANLSSLRKSMTDEEFALAYQAALNVVAPYVGLSREEQIYGITVTIRALFDSGMGYSMSTPHYNDPYGYFILGTASCAGCTRATGLCLNILGIPYEHVNENQYSHQWCRINVDGVYWISDAYGLYCGPEPAPYRHPWF